MYVETVNGTMDITPVKVPQSNNKESGMSQEVISVQPVEQSKINNELIEKRQEDMEKIKKVMKTMQENLPNTDAQFSVHTATNRIMIKLVDRTTHQVVREVPPEKALDILAKCMELNGVLLDKKI